MTYRRTKTSYQGHGSEFALVEESGAPGRNPQEQSWEDRTCKRVTKAENHNHQGPLSLWDDSANELLSLLKLYQFTQTFWGCLPKIKLEVGRNQLSRPSAFIFIREENGFAWCQVCFTIHIKLRAIFYLVFFYSAVNTAWWIGRSWLFQVWVCTVCHFFWLWQTLIFLLPAVTHKAFGLALFSGLWLSVDFPCTALSIIYPSWVGRCDWTKKHYVWKKS